MGAIDPFVKDYGGGIVAVGGEDSFALLEITGNTPLETVLPIYGSSGEKEIPKMAIALVIDHLGSMTGGNEHTNKAGSCERSGHRIPGYLKGHG